MISAENAECEIKVPVFKGLFFFNPFMISAENAKKCWFFMPHFFSLKHQRISTLYKHAYKNAEIRHNYEFIRALYLFFFTQS